MVWGFFLEPVTSWCVFLYPYSVFLCFSLTHRFPPPNANGLSVDMHVFPIEGCGIRVGVFLWLTNTHRQAHMHLELFLLEIPSVDDSFKDHMGTASKDGKKAASCDVSWKTVSSDIPEQLREKTELLRTVAMCIPGFRSQLLQLPSKRHATSPLLWLSSYSFLLHVD